jgi:hypothetical protein
MIKIYFTPSGGVVAGCTASVRIKLCVEITFVDIFMTIVTAEPDFPEAPFLSLFMTGKAGGCQVCTFEREPALVMLFDRI